MTCDGALFFASSQTMAETVSYLRLAAGSGTTLVDQMRPASRLAIPMLDVPSKLRSFIPHTHRGRWWPDATCDGCMGQPLRSTFLPPRPRRWRDALFEGPLATSRRIVCGPPTPRTDELRSQTAIWACGLPIAGAEGHPLLPLFLVWSSRSSEQGDTVFAIQGFSPIAGAAATIHLYANPLPTDFSAIMRTFHGDSPHASRSVHVLGRLSVHRFGNRVLPPDEQPA